MGRLDVDDARKAWIFQGAGFGVVYGMVVADSSGASSPGDLFWSAHDGYLSGTGGFRPAIRVGEGWSIFKTALSAGSGVIYGVLPNGILRWHRHLGWRSGEVAWEGGIDLDTGIDWSVYDRLVGGDGGFLLGVLPNGLTRAHVHLDWETGGPRFDGPLRITGTWRQFRHLFSKGRGISRSGSRGLERLPSDLSRLGDSQVVSGLIFCFPAGIRAARWANHYRWI